MKKDNTNEKLIIACQQLSEAFNKLNVSLSDYGKAIQLTKLKNEKKHPFYSFMLTNNNYSRSRN